MLGFGFDLLEFLDVLTKWFRLVHQAENKTLEELSRLIREISLLSLLRIFNIFLMYISRNEEKTRLLQCVLLVFPSKH